MRTFKITYIPAGEVKLVEKEEQFENYDAAVRSMCLSDHIIISVEDVTCTYDDYIEGQLRDVDLQSFGKRVLSFMYCEEYIVTLDRVISVDEFLHACLETAKDEGLAPDFAEMLDIRMRELEQL